MVGENSIGSDELNPSTKRKKTKEKKPAASHEINEDEIPGNTISQGKETEKR